MAIILKFHKPTLSHQNPISLAIECKDSHCHQSLTIIFEAKDMITTNSIEDELTKN